jgi:pSer/pThr/pTyr-binding forkhead associated (FHA) protein
MRTSAAPNVSRPEAPSFGFAPRDPSPATHCSNCKLAVTPGNTYCPECGALLTSEPSPIVAATRRSLPPNKPADTHRPGRAVDQGVWQPVIICPRCSRPNAFDATYCHDCGAAIGANAANRQNAILANPSAAQSTNHPSQPEPTSTRRPREFAAQTSAPVDGPCLQVIAQDGTTGRTFPIVAQRVDIGRVEGDILLPDDRFVCARHARLIRDGDRMTIQDLASVNGIYKRLRTPAKLEHDDVFLIGLALLKFELLAPGEQQLGGAVDRGTEVFGSPPRPRYARILEQTMEGVSRSIFVVTREETILGREVGDIVFSSDPFMSRRHAAITRNNSDGSFSLLDLGSSNGTFVRIRGQADLTPGDHLRVGQHLFRYDLNNAQVPGRVPGQGQAQAR